ncbi:MAG: hypothetical protein OZ921_09230, partial [Sorangiineae bacterium]|nr:hypothetical protein [Sorangiineae bacterium]
HALDDPEFARRQLALGARAASALMTARRAAALLATRSALTWAAFERTALENPDADLDRLSLLVARGVGGLPTPPPSEPIWAASPLLRGGPGVVESRVAGAMLGAALRDALRAKSRNAWISPSSGKWLVARFLADGVRWTLREKLVRALGGPLSVEPLVRYTSGG